MIILMILYSLDLIKMKTFGLHVSMPQGCANHKEKLKFKIKGRNLFVYDLD